MIHADENDSIEMMARFEEIVGHLYAAYSWLFPDYADFWSHLAIAERQHAKLVRELRGTGIGSSDSRGQINFPIRMVETSTAMVRKSLEDAWAGNVSILRALSTASNLENALLERKFYDMLVVDDAEAEKRLESIVMGTQEHRNAIARALDAAKMAV